MTFFWETGDPLGGLGGDGLGREFGFFDDGMIHEYDPFVDDGTFTSTLSSPADVIDGMGFDGINLYASTASGSVFTLNPDTGAVLGVIDAPRGALFGLGAIPGDVAPVPEPGSFASMLIVLAGACGGYVRRCRRRVSNWATPRSFES